MTSSHALRDDLAALAWSLWAELGVSGWTRHHSRWMVDPEALLVFTAWLGDTDARLRDEATDWCIQFGSWLSGTRLTNLLEAACDHTRAHFGELAATVAAHSSLRWRGATKARVFKPTGRSRLESFQAPSLLALRLRAILGVGARAEVIRILLATPDLWCLASDLVDDAGFKKRNVADALESLSIGGALEAQRTRNHIQYRIADSESWHRLLGEMPQIWPRWTSLLPLFSVLADADSHLHGLPARVRNVEVTKLLRDQAQLIQRSRVPSPPAPSQDGKVAEVFEDWLVRVVQNFAQGNATEIAQHNVLSNSLSPGNSK